MGIVVAACICCVFLVIVVVMKCYYRNKPYAGIKEDRQKVVSSSLPRGTSPVYCVCLLPRSESNTKYFSLFLKKKKKLSCSTDHWAESSHLRNIPLKSGFTLNRSKSHSKGINFNQKFIVFSVNSCFFFLKTALYLDTFNIERTSKMHVFFKRWRLNICTC